MKFGELTLDAGTLRGLLNKSGIVELREVGLQVGVPSATTFGKDDLVNRIVEKVSAQKRPMTGKYYEATDYDVNEIVQYYLGNSEYKEIEAEGYIDEYEYGGMLREEDTNSGKNEIFVPKWIMEKYDLRGGDYVIGSACHLSSNSVDGMIKVDSVNGEQPLTQRRNFAELKVYPPKSKIALSLPDPLSTIDVYTPAAEGMRILWKTETKGNVLSKYLADIPASFEAQGIKTYSLFLGEAPELKADITDKIERNLFYTTFDEDVKENLRIAHVIFDRAKREVEEGKRIAIILSRIESIDTYSNFNAIRSMFGSAKYCKNGSLTIVMCSRRDYSLDDIADNVTIINNHNGELFHDYFKSYSSLRNKE